MKNNKDKKENTVQVGIQGTSLFTRSKYLNCINSDGYVYTDSIEEFFGEAKAKIIYDLIVKEYRHEKRITYAGITDKLGSIMVILLHDRKAKGFLRGGTYQQALLINVIT